MMDKQPPIRLTQSAQIRLELLLSKGNFSGVRVRLRTRGCSGLSYVMEYVDVPSQTDESISLSKDYKLFIHKQALLFLIGTEMDYEETAIRSGFVFKNPNEKGQCGCGSSFHV